MLSPLSISSQFTGKKKPIEYIKTELQKYNKKTAIQLLSKINQLLINNNIKNNQIGVQGFLFDWLFSPFLKSKILSMNSGVIPDFFSRNLILLAQRIILAKEELNQENKEIVNSLDYFEFGFYLFLLTDHLETGQELSEIEPLLGTNFVTPQSQTEEFKLRKETALRSLNRQIGITTELNYYSSSIGFLSSSIFCQVLKETLEKINSESSIDLQNAKITFYQTINDKIGLDFEKLIDIVLLLAFWPVSHENEEILDGKNFFINLDRFFEETTISVDDGKLVFDALSATFDEFEERLNSEDILSKNFSVFRKKPLLNYDGKHFIVLDAAYLIEFLSTGAFYIASENRDPRININSHIGRLFEQVINNLLTSSFPRSDNLINYFKLGPKFQNPSNEAFDGILYSNPDHAFVFQCKCNLLKADVKYSGSFENLYRDMGEKFGKDKSDAATVQIIKNLNYLWNMNEDIRRRLSGEFPEFSTASPLIVTMEPFFLSPLFNQQINIWFNEEVNKPSYNINPDNHISKIVVIHIFDLVRILPLIEEGDVNFYQLLSDYRENFLSLPDSISFSIYLLESCDLKFPDANIRVNQTGAVSNQGGAGNADSNRRGCAGGVASRARVS